MFTRDEMILIAMVLGNRSIDVRYEAMEHPAASPITQQENLRYARDLRMLSDKAHEMIQAGSFDPDATHTCYLGNLKG